MSQQNQITTPVNDTLIAEMTKIIVDTVNPQQVILFGSYAQGTANPNSDLDLMIVADQAFTPAHSRRQEMARLWRSLARFSVPKDILIYSRDEVERWRHAQNHVIAYALREGKLLYERT